MVVLHIKRADESQFLYTTSIDSQVEDVINNVVAIYNGRLKVYRICFEIEELGKHGTFLPEQMQGLNDDQIKELKLEDPWGKKCAPPNHIFNKDPIGRRSGLAPQPQMKEVLMKAIETAKEIIDKKHVDMNKCLVQRDISRALDELKGATMIVFPGGLPPHDPVRQEFDNVEDLKGTQASLEVIDPTRACLWACGKQLHRGRKLSDHLGNNDKCKLIVKLSATSEGAPAREPIMSDKERKELMLQAYRRQEELKKLEQDDDDSYLGSQWSDSGNLKRHFHGLNNISWRPK